MKKLQVAIEVNTDADKHPEINVTPVDIPVTPEVAAALELAISQVDQSDAIPHDGQIQEKTHIKVPVRINLWVAHLNTDVNVDATAIVRLVDAS